MFIAAIISNTLAAYFIASIFREFLVFFVAFFALVILNMEILSLFGVINEQNVLIFSIINLIFAFAYFKYKKTKPLKPNFDFKRLKNALLLDKSLIVLSCAFLILFCVSLFLALVMPVLEPDSQTYHFLRAFEFIQNKSLSHFETNDIRALIMPFNSEIFYSWMFLFKKNFHGYGVLSFAAFNMVIFCLWNIFEEFKYSYRKRLYAIFLLSSFSCVIIQIPSLQTDLVVGTFLLLAFCLFIKNSIYFSSLSLALALGIKTTGVMAFLAFFVSLILYEILIEKNKNLDKIKRFLPLFCLNFLIFSSYNYILNIIHFHSPFSNRAAYLGHGFWGGYRGFIANLIHFFFQAFDFTGFKWGYYLNSKVLALKDSLFHFVHINPLIGCNVRWDRVNIITDEQTVGFGILGFMVFLPVWIMSLFKIFFNKNKKTILNFIFALAFLINILVLARAMAYMIFSIRFVVAFAVFSSIFLISVYKKKSPLKPLILFFCLFYMILIPFHNRRMPFWVVANSIKRADYNLSQFEDDCYEGKVILVLKVAAAIDKTIKEKYSDKKNIAFIKKLSSPALYLKKHELKGKKVDFLSAGNVDIEKLKNYDLVILEGEAQNDNVFNPDEIEKKYKVVEGDIIFDSNENLNCYWIYVLNKWEAYKDNALERNCFTHPYMLNQKAVFKLDYSEKAPDADFIYYFINQIKD